MRSGEPPRSTSVEAFAQYLETTGQSYLIQGEPRPHAVRLRFTGRFEGRDVVWDCEFVTLAEEYRRLHDTGNGVVAGGLRNFLDVGVADAQLVPIRVGLDLPGIDAAEIEKMIIMVRNYKRLHRGRHDFGDSYAPA